MRCCIHLPKGPVAVHLGKDLRACSTLESARRTAGSSSTVRGIGAGPSGCFNFNKSQCLTFYLIFRCLILICYTR